jgi:hypothetical protein
MVFPKLLEVFLEQIGSHCLEVVAWKVAQPEALQAGEICLAFEHPPPRFRQDWLVPILREILATM